VINRSSILMTGGTGALVKSLTSHILSNYPGVKKIIIFSRDEQKQFHR
jgi:FlaA1/EpsC-like NDP-sugar epimerase